MTTLTADPLASVLKGLFAEAEASMPAMRQRMAATPPEELRARMAAKTEYVELYTRLKDFPLAVSRETGALLYLLARSIQARSIVEFGTSFGVSTLHLAAALKDNGGGRLITTEFEPSKAIRARENLAAGGLADLVEIREGDALDTLASDLPDTIDLLLLDGAKSLYMDVLGLVENRLRRGAVIIADNADHCPEYLEHVGDPSHGYLSMAFTEEVELTIRLG